MIARPRIVLLGSTGSIGRSTLDVVARHPGRFQIEGLAAHSNVARLLAQVKRFHPRWVALGDPEAAAQLQRRLAAFKPRPRVLAGPEGLRQIARVPRATLVVSAIVGTAGLLPTLEAIQHGKDVALANKETLVMAGELVMALVKQHHVRLLPVDSEHAALTQCLAGHQGIAVQRMILTASGGPFVGWTRAQLRSVTAADALRHPTWSMGKKISVDSATLMNKGLELIEAHHLFAIPYERLEVAVHPQSIVHSLVEFVDGSTLAQMSRPDMRLPIQAALTAPERVPGLVQPLNYRQGLHLDFGPPDHRRFPCLSLAYAAGRRGGTAPAVLNAANEVAVQAFLAGRLRFLEIANVIQKVLRRHGVRPALRLETILRADQWARRQAEEEVAACKV